MKRRIGVDQWDATEYHRIAVLATYEDYAVYVGVDDLPKHVHEVELEWTGDIITPWLVPVVNGVRYRPRRVKHFFKPQLAEVS